MQRYNLPGPATPQPPSSLHATLAEMHLTDLGVEHNKTKRNGRLTVVGWVFACPHARVGVCASSSSEWVWCHTLAVKAYIQVSNRQEKSWMPVCGTMIARALSTKNCSTTTNSTTTAATAVSTAVAPQDSSQCRLEALFCTLCPV